MTDDYGRELGALQGEVRGHEGWIQKLEDEIKALGRTQQENHKEIMAQMTAQRIELAERKGAERVAMWLAGGVGAIGTAVLSYWIKVLWPPTH